MLRVTSNILRPRMKSCKLPSGTGGTSVSAVNVQKLSCTVENFCLLKLSRFLDSDKLNNAQVRSTQRDLGVHSSFLNMLRSKIVLHAEYRENYCG